MAAALIRLLTLLALAMMPFGMAVAPAAASTSSPHHTAMSMNAVPCDDQSSDEDEREAAIDCATACSMMVADQPKVEARLALPPETASWTPLQRMPGLHPEMEPPPPKRG